MQDQPVCFITGASSGFGEGFALRLAREGYRVGLAARRKEKLEEVAERVRAAGGQAGVFPCDVAVKEEIQDAIRACEAELGPVDLLIANAGVSINTLLRQFDSEEVERVLRVNLLGAIYAVEGVLPGMLERDRGQIVAVSSLAGFGGLPKAAAYSASKAGMINFFESLRLDLLRTGVDVTTICPGFVRTEMTSHNKHPMPFLMDLEPAVEKMVTAILKRRKSLAFPWPLAGLAWVARIFPRSLYDAITGKVKRDKAQEAGARL